MEKTAISLRVGINAMFSQNRNNGSQLLISIIAQEQLAVIKFLKKNQYNSN